MCNDYICKVRGHLAALIDTHFGNLYEAHTLVCNMVNSGEVFLFFISQYITQAVSLSLLVTQYSRGLCHLLD